MRLSDVAVGTLVIYGWAHLTVALVDMVWATVTWTCRKLNLPIPAP
jgi:hypothetical protein